MRRNCQNAACLQLAFVAALSLGATAGFAAEGFTSSAGCDGAVCALSACGLVVSESVDGPVESVRGLMVGPETGV